MAEESEDKGNFLWEAAKAVGRVVYAVGEHVVMPALEQAIPAGTGELSQALFTGHGYHPGGPMDIPAKGEEQQRPEEGLETPSVAREPEEIEL